MDSRVLVILLATLFLLPTDVTLSQELNGSTAVSSQELLPASTKAWLSIPDSKRLDEKFLETQMGKLAQDEKFAPFMDGLKAQFRNWMNEKNVRLGLDMSDVQDIRSGEICIAGILPAQAQGGEKLGRGSHGMVVLVDVSDNLDEANDLMDKVGKDLIQRGATKEDYEDVFGAEVSKWKFPRKNELEIQRFAYQTISNGWLLSSDNEIIFRKIVRRLVNIDNAKAGETTLASQDAFQNVMDTVKLKDIEPQIYWYVNPFGYIQLAQAIAREREEFRQANNDDWARILKKIGFDGFKGVGGYIAFATGQHELLHRTYVYKPTSEEQEAKQKRVFGLFDFENKKKSSLAPPAFVSDSVSGYFCAAWNMQRALKNVGYVIDTFVKKQGTLDDTLENLKVEMNVDVPDVVSKFDNEIIVISETKMPVSNGSERLSIAIRSTADPDETIEVIKRSWPHQHVVSEFKRFKIVNIDDSIGADETDFEGGIFEDPGEWGEEEEEEAEPQFSVFENRFCSATDDFMFVANNEDELKTILSGDSKTPLAQSQDYLRVSESLDQFSDDSRISFRQFSRLDRVIRPNYEVLRAGKMAASDTVLARLMNYMFATKNKNADAPRKQKIDGSTLPSDFEKDVAPYFGPSGWLMESTQDGWLISGVVLERTEVANQVVKKEDVSSQNR